MAIEILRRRPVAELQPRKMALRLITSFEGLSLKAYRDSVGILTAGYGHTGPDVLEGMQITLAQADAWLAEDIAEAWDIVRTSVQVPLTQGEADALTSITFNIGRVPRSMLAALNGGVSDKGEVYAPGSYGSALKQFVRNCRAGGVPLRGLYRRRLAECCVFSDLPFENACSISVVRLEVDAAKNIVPSGTTSLEDTLMRARQDLPILRPDTSDTMRAPWPAPRVEVAPAPLPDAPIASQNIPVQLPIPDADELLLDQPAASESIPDTKAAAPSHPQPEVEPTAHSVPNTGSSKPASPVPVPTAPQSPPGPVSPLPPPKLPDPPIPIGQQTSAVDAARKSEEWSANTKAMWQSRRFYGLVLVMIGRLWMLKTGSNAVLGAVSDPLVSEFVGGFCVMIAGEILQFWGQKKATKALR